MDLQRKANTDGNISVSLITKYTEDFSVKCSYSYVRSATK